MKGLLKISVVVVESDGELLVGLDWELSWVDSLRLHGEPPGLGELGRSARVDQHHLVFGVLSSLNAESIDSEVHSLAVFPFEKGWGQLNVRPVLEGKEVVELGDSPV